MGDIVMYSSISFDNKQWYLVKVINIIILIIYWTLEKLINKQRQNDQREETVHF